MALRRRLRELFQDPQLDGVIIVERPSCSATATRAAEPSLPAAAIGTRVSKQSCSAAATRASQPSLPAATISTRVPKPPCFSSAFATRVPEPSSAAAASGMQPPSCSSTPSLPPCRRPPLPEGCAVFQCRGCRAVLGDSLHLCSQEARLGILVCFKVTNGVTWEDSLVIGLEGFPVGCAYYSLSCQSCGCIVGFILYSATRHLAHLRGFFCLFKDSILCYLLKKQITIEATNFNFPAVTLKRKLQELKEKLVEVHIRIEMLMKMLEELEQKSNMAEKQSLTSEAADLPPGYAIVRVN